MKITREKGMANFTLILKPENKKNNKLLLEMIKEGYYESYSQKNNDVKELSVYPEKNRYLKHPKK